MPSELALFLCIIFIAYVFILDFKWKPNSSAVPWIPLIWMMIIATKPVADWISTGPQIATEESYISGSPVDRIIFIILMIIGTFILFWRAKAVSQILKNNAWLLLFILFCGISILWSDFPAISFRRFLRGIGTLIMVLVVLTEDDPIESLKSLIRRCAYVIMPLSILFIKYYTEIGVRYSVFEGHAINVGATNNKNTLGRICLICGFLFFYSIYEIWHDKKLFFNKRILLVHLLLLFLIFWLLIKADSATSLASLIIGICIFVALGMPIIKRNPQYIGVFILFSVLIFLFFYYSFDLYKIVTSLVNRNLTLTGRTALWQDLISLVSNPLLGVGYDSFWLGERMNKLWEAYWWQPDSAHNGYLETYLNLGLIGLAFWIGVIFSKYRSITKILVLNFGFGRFQMSYFVIFLIYNITESAFQLRSIMVFVFFLITLYLPRNNKTFQLQKELPISESI